MSKEPDPLAGNARDDWNDWRDDQGVYPTALNPPAQQELVADGLIRQYINSLVANKPDEAANTTKAMVDYVYTSPPAQRPWVGLTLEIKMDMAESYFTDEWAINRAIQLLSGCENALKEKNNG